MGNQAGRGPHPRHDGLDKAGPEHIGSCEGCLLTLDREMLSATSSPLDRCILKPPHNAIYMRWLLRRILPQQLYTKANVGCNGSRPSKHHSTTCKDTVLFNVDWDKILKEGIAWWLTRTGTPGRALRGHCVHTAHAEAGILTQEYLSPDWLHSEAAKPT